MARQQKRLWSESLREAERKTEADPQEIARVAYELYERRGRQDGHDQEDWFRAEEIVRKNRNKRAYASS